MTLRKYPPLGLIISLISPNNGIPLWRETKVVLRQDKHPVATRRTQVDIA